MEKLDSYDFRILGILQGDASESVAVVAEAVNLSVNACWRRIRRLETEGYIRKRVALLNPDLLGVPTIVFVMIRTAEHSEEWLESFAAMVQDMAEIVEIYRLSGEIDYLLKLRVADIAAYDRAYKRLIGGVKLTDVSSAFAMEEIKNTTLIPLAHHR